MKGEKKGHITQRKNIGSGNRQRVLKEIEREREREYKSRRTERETHFSCFAPKP